MVESLSGAILLWRLSSGDHREELALRLVGASFLVLAAYVSSEAFRTIYLQEPPSGTYLGIAIAALSLIVMPILAREKRKVASRLNSGALHADSRQTDICAYLSAILLGGLGLNALFGWWWADPAAALAMVPLIVWEGIKGLRGENCCA